MIKPICIFLGLMYLVIPPANAGLAYTCGVVDHESYRDGQLYRMKCDAFDHADSYCVCDNGFQDWHAFVDHVCVSYSYDSKDSDTYYMSNCFVNEYSCTAHRFFNRSIDELTGQKEFWCEDCPTGFAAGDDINRTHTDPRCPYCAVGYYGSGLYDNGTVSSGCTPCPNGGTTKNTNSKYITDCYTIAPSGAQTDSTGTFIYTPDNLECWWKN